MIPKALDEWSVPAIIDLLTKGIFESEELSGARQFFEKFRLYVFRFPKPFVAPNAVNPPTLLHEDFLPPDVIQPRPPGGDSHPDRTRSEYCVYDSVHKDYLYTRAWVEKLVRELSDANRFREIVGPEPVTKGGGLAKSA